MWGSDINVSYVLPTNLFWTRKILPYLLNQPVIPAPKIATLLKGKETKAYFSF